MHTAEAVMALVYLLMSVVTSQEVVRMQCRIIDLIQLS